MASQKVQYLLMLTTGIGIIAFAYTHTTQNMCGFVDYALATASFNESIVKTQKLCFSLCLSRPDCKSANYLPATQLCALNDLSHWDSSQKLRMEQGSFYAFREQWFDCSMSQAKIPTQLADSSETWTDQELPLIGMLSKQSSTTNSNYEASRANDGHAHQVMINHPYCAHTAYELHPWWLVDMGGEHWLGTITVVTRKLCCGERLVGATVRAGVCIDFTKNIMCGSPVSPAQAQNGAWIEFVCIPRTLARYVSVDINTGNPNSSLNICEVMVREYINVKKISE